MTLLAVDNLSVTLATNDGPARAVRDLTFTYPGATAETGLTEFRSEGKEFPEEF